MSSKKPRVLVVDDDPGVRKLVEYNLSLEGYEVITASGGKEALKRAQNETPDLVLLDVIMPDLNGLRVCQSLRSISQVPIVMLTAKAQESEILHGFDVGADDYLTKPFSAKELIARVRAVLRRTNQREQPHASVQTCGSLEVDFARRTVRARGQAVHLTRTEFALLKELALNANRVMTHRDLLKAVWGPEYVDDVDYLRAYVRHLRRKLEADPASPRYILTSQGVGYMLACPKQT